MNLIQLTHLAQQASGDGIKWQIEMDCSVKHGEPEMRLLRFDMRGDGECAMVTYNDGDCKRMSDAATARFYQPYAAGLMRMREDAQLNHEAQDNRFGCTHAGGEQTRDRILKFIRAYVDEHGYSPTLREIAPAAYLTTPATVQMHLKVLQRQGKLTYIPHQSRTIVLLEDE